EADALVAVGQVLLEDVQRGGDHAADALDGVGPERAAAVLQGVAEGGILTPAVKRAAFDLQLPRHLPSRPADGKQFDGRPLPLAQIGCVGRGGDVGGVGVGPFGVGLFGVGLFGVGLFGVGLFGVETIAADGTL